MSRRSYITQANRRRQWLREQINWDRHGQNGLNHWKETHPRPKLKRQEKSRYHSVISTIKQNSKPGNSHFIIFPSSMATEDRVRPGERHSRPSMPSASESPSEQVKKVGGDHVNQHPDDQKTPFPTSSSGAAQDPMASSEAWEKSQEPALRA